MAALFANLTRAAAAGSFELPAREEALVSCDSVSWRVFKNPIALLAGGIAAVILELADPRIRTAIWKKSTFLSDPLGRLQRTGLAAMVTIYGARSIAEPMIARVVQMHSRVSGLTPAGSTFSAADPQLLAWVHATATFCFAGAYSHYVETLTPRDLDTICEEALPVSRLYGAIDVPGSHGEIVGLLHQTLGQLEPSEELQEFLHIMRHSPLLPLGLRWLQPIAVRAAVDLIPRAIRERLGLATRDGLRFHEETIIKMAGAVANKIVLPTSPASQACIRLGLPATYLYR